MDEPGAKSGFDPMEAMARLEQSANIDCRPPETPPPVCLGGERPSCDVINGRQRAARPFFFRVANGCGEWKKPRPSQRAALCV